MPRLNPKKLRRPSRRALALARAVQAPAGRAVPGADALPADDPPLFDRIAAAREKTRAEAAARAPLRPEDRE